MRQKIKDKHVEEETINAEAEFEVMHPRAKECQQLQETGKDKQKFCTRTFGRSVDLLTL